MIENWIHAQTDVNVAQFDEAMEAHYPESREYLQDPRKYLARIGIQCNFMDAVKMLDWEQYLGKAGTVLDMGCGGGWLTGYLSAFASVNKIYALDSSRHFVRDILPGVVELMGGDKEKIAPIQGLFTPLLFKDGVLDVVVASSVLHHAESLEGVLTEIRRTMKKGGLLCILNETPSSAARHLLSVSKGFVKIVANLMSRNYMSVSPAISSSGYLNNPHLGDRNYPLWYWNEAIRRAGFSIVKYLDTGLPTVKGERGQSLCHFVCKAV